MSLQQRLMNDMKAAMKEKAAGKLRLGVIRMVRSAIRNKEIDGKKSLTEGEVLDVIGKELKQRRDSIVEFEKAGRPDLVDQLQKEIAVLMTYMPEQMSEEEIRRLVLEALQATGAQGPKDMGKVMAMLMPKVKGKADGKLVNQIVREMIGK